MKKKKYTRLSEKERIQIESYLLVHKTVTQIAELLNRPKSTISREIKRCKSLPGKWYSADQAHWHAVFRNRLKRIDSKLSQDKMLRDYVIKRLKQKWSPEQVANRIKREYPLDPNMRISYESIYKYIYFEAQEDLKKQLVQCLTYNKPKRHSGAKRSIYMGKIPGRITIEQRPEEITSRKEEGHWEGDLVIGKGQTSAIGTLVERKTRYTIIVPLKSKKSTHVVNAFANELLALPENFRKSLTYDNGIEMTKHRLFTQITKMNVYFAHPYSSWERGTNENTNGLIRRVFKKKTDFNKVLDFQLKELQESLNTRPRKILNWKTPQEKLLELCA
ncbi:MAG TPA: IS30 family transposase [Bacteroidales bacterium]|nr:IS30 family transposase [Balneolales bacterium]HYX08062.1 IS30 family transposase [Bacteroidales bacterium]